jgi:hypothetical protein
LKTITWNSAIEVITLKLDRHYWPAYELRRTDKGWQRFDLEKGGLSPIADAR